MRFELRTIGTNAALPMPGRFTTCQALNIQEHHFLIDCGEGAQIRMEQYRVKKSKIKHIFISHLHGDHYFGLWGLLNSYNLQGRQQDLYLYSPPGLKALLLPPLVSGGVELCFPLYFIEVDPTQHCVVFENNQLSVATIPLIHRIPACGYVFREKERPRKMISDQILKYQLSVPQILAAKAGKDIEGPDGQIISNETLTVPAPRPRSYAFCSDTRYTESILPYIKGVDLLYHESTFCQEHLERAKVTKHSTAMEAAQIARQADVGKLLLGHFSSRYEEIGQFEREARTIFPESYATNDGDLFEVPYFEEEEE